MRRNHVRELRRITGKPSLTPKQVLEQLDIAVAILSEDEDLAASWNQPDLLHHAQKVFYVSGSNNLTV